MTAEQRKLHDDLITSLSICDERIRVSQKNANLHKELTSKLKADEQLLEDVRATANHLTSMYKNIKFFLENKKSQSKDILETAIRSTSAIVKDSSLESCTIMHENGKTRILDGRGQNINKREGSAARATMGFILRYTCLKALPNKIQIMFLDEALATLSSTTAINLREIIESFSENIGIVGIEQKNVLYSGLASKRYSATKVGDYTTIREEEPDIGSEIDSTT